MGAGQEEPSKRMRRSSRERTRDEQVHMHYTTRAARGNVTPGGEVYERARVEHMEVWRDLAHSAVAAAEGEVRGEGQAIAGKRSCDRLGWRRSRSGRWF
eukprot:COSAG06_NODE_27468_length_592_cov_2.204868_1_plen_99_part_00